MKKHRMLPTHRQLTPKVGASNRSDPRRCPGPTPEVSGQASTQQPHLQPLIVLICEVEEPSHVEKELC